MSILVLWIRGLILGQPITYGSKSGDEYENELGEDVEVEIGYGGVVGSVLRCMARCGGRIRTITSSALLTGFEGICQYYSRLQAREAEGLSV
jgi:hypothetical protein